MEGSKMKNYLRRTVTILMCLVMFVSITSCSDGAQSSSSGSSGSTSSSQSSSGGNEPAAAPKVTIFINKSPAGDIDNSDETKARMHDFYLETCNIDYQYIIPPKEQVEDKLNLLLASSSTDLNAFWGDWTKYEDKNVIRSIETVWDPEVYAGIEREFMTKSSSLKDNENRVWGIPRNFAVAAYPFEWRKDYADKLGLAYPPKTLEDVNTYLYAFRDKDPAGNGNTIPLVSTSVEDLAWCLLGGFTDYGNNKWLDPTDNKIKLPIAQPGYKDFIRQVATWYADGILYKEFYTLDWSTLREYAASGRAAAAFAWYTAWGNGFSRIFEADSTTQAVAGITHMLTGPNGQQCEYPKKPDYRGLLFTRNTTDEQVAALLRMMDYQCEHREAFYDAAYGYEGWEYTDDAKSTIHIKTPEELPANYAFFNAYDVAQGMLILDEYQSVVKENALYADSNGETGNPFGLYIYAFAHYQPVEKLRKTFDWNIPFNETAVTEQVPQLSDIQRAQDEELLKFVIGTRSLDEWDAFIESLYKIGMDRVEDAFTAQYELYK